MCTSLLDRPLQKRVVMFSQNRLDCHSGRSLHQLVQGMVVHKAHQCDLKCLCLPRHFRVCRFQTSQESPNVLVRSIAQLTVAKDGLVRRLMLSDLRWSIKSIKSSQTVFLCQ